ncbi:MAG TPA: cupin [Burkholderiales bacterium]|nr:cupin [Burkholderiales bacterium]
MLANVFDALPGPGAGEALDVLLARPGLRIERIVSHAHATPPGYWYDQPQGEWVMLVAGAARLRFEDEPAPRSLGPGDCLDIAANRRHRVEWTHPDEPTIWIAIHYGEVPT